MVSLRIEVPKGLAQFIRDLGNFGGSQMSLKSWVESEIVQAAGATLDSIDDGEFIQGAVLRKRYGLETTALPKRVGVKDLLAVHELSPRLLIQHRQGNRRAQQGTTLLADGLMLLTFRAYSFVVTDSLRDLFGIVPSSVHDVPATARQ